MARLSLPATRSCFKCGLDCRRGLGAYWEPSLTLRLPSICHHRAWQYLQKFNADYTWRRTHSCTAVVVACIHARRRQRQRVLSVRTIPVKRYDIIKNHPNTYFYLFISSLERVFLEAKFKLYEIIVCRITIPN